ncbi:Uncharacterised protein [Mycobacteroides abscessus subsp. massiliense]|nr:Uncharacterised protein [Mycobacteroides abscessus subsp. massiliense]
MNRIGKRQAFRYDCMAGLMIGCRTFFIFVHHHAATLRTHVDFVFCIFKVALIDFHFIATTSKQSCFIDQVCQIRT